MKTTLSATLGTLAAVAIAAALAVAGGTHGSVLYGLPLFWWCAALAFAVQWMCFIPAYIYQTEKYYDLVGSLTYIGLALSSLYHASQIDLGRVLVAGMVIVWATRLGGFLFLRIRADGKDVRFDKIKPSFPLFLRTWTLQGLWVFFTFSAGLAALTSAEPFPVTAVTLAGVTLWLFGFTAEVVADSQKRRFRADPDKSSPFIQTGLWSYSRHPNYVGEILLWLGIALAALPQLQGWQLMTLLSPCFVYLLLTRISGVPLLEYMAKKRWGESAEYQAYLERTPVLFPWNNR